MEVVSNDDVVIHLMGEGVVGAGGRFAGARSESVADNTDCDRFGGIRK